MKHSKTNITKIKKKLLEINKRSFPSGKMIAAIATVGKTEWVGFNCHKSHPRMTKRFSCGKENSCSHAELSAVIQVPKKLRHKITLYVIRFTRDGNISMAKPCELCKVFLSQQGIDFGNIYYSDWSWDGNWKRMKHDDYARKKKRQ
jgi:cytidine deaminase